MTKAKEIKKKDGQSIFQGLDTLVITGAGFSYDANLPLEKDVIPRGIEKCKREKPEIIDSIKYHAQHLLNIDNIFDFSIEEMLTKIKMIELYSISKYDYVRDIMAFEQSVLRLFSKTLELSEKNKLTNIYFDFINKFKNNTTFATFNNDFLLERIFTELQMFWTYTIEDENVEVQLGSKDFYYKSQEAAKYSSKPKIIPYLKLHGSFNWHCCWRCGRVRITSDKNFGISGISFIPGITTSPLGGFFILSCGHCVQNGSPELKPLIIPPALIKYYELTFIRKLWLHFDILLRNVKRVIIIGSSLRSEDILFLNYLNFLKEKNPKLKKIVLINPDEKTKNRLEILTNFEIEWYEYLKDFI